MSSGQNSTLASNLGVASGTAGLSSYFADLQKGYLIVLVAGLGGGMLLSLVGGRDNDT